MTSPPTVLLHSTVSVLTSALHVTCNWNDRAWNNGAPFPRPELPPEREEIAGNMEQGMRQAWTRWANQMLYTINDSPDPFRHPL
jgi:hypothetical protein